MHNPVRPQVAKVEQHPIGFDFHSVAGHIREEGEFMQYSAVLVLSITLIPAGKLPERVPARDR